MIRKGQVRWVSGADVRLRRPQFSWTRIRGESDVTGGRGHGSVEEGEGSRVGATGVGADAAAVGSGALARGQRWSASRKRDVVLRLLRGESLDTVSRDVGVEDDGETFTLVLSNASGAGFANNDQEAVGTIRDANPDGSPDPDPESDPEPVPALPLLGQLLLALALAAGGARSARRRGVSPPRAV